jgi:hypothetical protein
MSASMMCLIKFGGGTNSPLVFEVLLAGDFIFVIPCKFMFHYRQLLLYFDLPHIGDLPDPFEKNR